MFVTRNTTPLGTTQMDSDPRSEKARKIPGSSEVKLSYSPTRNSKRGVLMLKIPKRNHTILQIATYNARTLSSRQKMLEMEMELEKIKWDVVGVSEVRKPGEECVKLQSGHTFFYRGSDSQMLMHGVGLFIHKRWSNRITHTKSISDRVIYVCLKINSKYSIKVIQAYAPTSTHDDEEVETFYEDIEKALDENRSYFQYIVGDFNAKIGKREEESETSIGKFSYDQRNERGDTLLNFLQQHNLFAMNSFFTGKAQRKWTWASPDGVTKNEIDYIITNRKSTVKNVTVLNQFTTGSDHRMVRAKVTLNTRFQRSKLVKRRERIDAQRLYEQSEEFATQMSAELVDIDNQYDTLDELNNKIVESIKSYMETKCKSIHLNESKLSQETLDLIANRVELIKNGKRDSVEYRNLSKTINKAMRSDLRKYNVRLAENTIQANCNMKVLRSKLSNVKKEIFKLRDKTGTIKSDRSAILDIAKEFYEDLFSSKRSNPNSTSDEDRPVIMNVGSEDLPDITVDEVKAAVDEMKNKKSPGEDGVPIEAIKLGGDSLLSAITTLFNQCLQWEMIPKQWENAEITLLHKKGDITKLENYRPISLLSTLYKLFMKIITKRNTKKFDFYQPVEQAGFRSGFSTNDHLQVMRTLIEKCNEYKISIVLIFIDFEKAFDSVETWSIWDSLDECRVDSRYSKVLQYVYENATSCIKLHENTTKFRIGRGVRQGDTISPKLFTSVLESVFKKLDWSKKGIDIKGEFLSHLRFADDIVLVALDLDEAQVMLEELNEEANKVGLKMNLSKTKIMTNIEDDREMKIGDTVVEKVDSYVYLGHKLKLGLDNQTAEIKRRIGLAWAAFGRLRLIFKSKMNNSLKRKVFDTCVLPVLTYGAETLTLTKASENKLRVAQRAMERSMLGITLRDKMTNQWIREQTKVVDVMERIASLKWSWAGHIARRTDDRWTHAIMNWRPSQKRPMGRPPERWTNGIKKYIKDIYGHSNWQQVAMNRTEWKRLGEAYIQQWIQIG